MAHERELLLHAVAKGGEYMHSLDNQDLMFFMQTEVLTRARTLEMTLALTLTPSGGAGARFHFNRFHFKGKHFTVWKRRSLPSLPPGRCEAAGCP